MSEGELTMDEIIRQISGLRENARTEGRRQDEVACTAVINTLLILSEEGYKTYGGVVDFLEDYKTQAKICQGMDEHFMAAAEPVKKGGVWRCPNCHLRVRGSDRLFYCHRCGKRLVWDNR